GDTLPPEPKLLAGAGARRDGQGLEAIEGRDLDPGPEDRLGDGNRHFDREIPAFPREIRMRLDGHRDDQVGMTGRIPLPSETDLGARLEPRGDLDDFGLSVVGLTFQLDRGLAASNRREE